LALGLALAPPDLCAGVSVQKPAQAVFQVLSLGFGAIAAIAIVFCCIAGFFGMASWPKLLNIIGWTAAGGAGLSLASWGVSLAV
jgi:type IV secretory pathway VirB2 component (pilin)